MGVKPNSDYRENPERAIYLTGKIDQALVDRLTPKINELRLSSDQPITAYIDSSGGSVQHAEFIRRLVTAPNPDDRCCRLITVVTGTAASAEADFLALGNYAIAYSHTEILYHGSRQSLGSSLTFEGASTLASSLRRTNEFFAVRLARHAFPRFALRLTQLKGAFAQFVNSKNPIIEAAPITDLIGELRKNLRRENWRLLREALRRQRTIRDLSLSVGKHLNRFKDSSKMTASKFESEMLRAIVNYKVKIHKKDDEKAQWLTERSEQKLQPLWYFMVSLCRLLQSDDFDLNPKEAYWLGLIDEVPGSDLPNLRVMFENAPPLNE